MNKVLPIIVACFSLSVFLPVAVSAPPSPDKLRMEPWTPANMVKDPVAVSFDDQGRLYVVETARRSTVDIDMRAHRPWLLEDLANYNFETMRDFFRKQMSAERSDNNKDWLKDRNNDGVHDYRDLTTIKERIRIVEDTDGDGMADKSTLFAEGFNEEFNGVAAGVMPYRGDVFFTVYPDLWRLRDHDGDGKADSKESMFRGFGVHAALDGHDLHGLTVGPEGKIYFSCGDNGFSIKTQEGKRLHYPNTGGVLRMNPDGSDLEVFAIGLRNVQEFDFDAFGNMFGVDNDGDLEDERERAVYIAEGSDSGWRLTWQFRSPGWAKHNGGMTYNPWVADGMWKPQHEDQPAYITPPMQNYSVGPGGFKFNPGTALNDEYRDFFFCVQFPVKKITAFRTVADGAGFKMADDHVFNSGLMVSSMNFGPDGAFYLADWVGKWQPNNEGIIYRVDDPDVDGSELRKEVKRIINQGVEAESTDSLVALLGHADRRIRQLAQRELAVSRKQLQRLLVVANDPSASQLARIHALWGVIQYHQQNSVSASELKLPWNDADRQVRQQCARVAGDLNLASSAEELIEQLRDAEPLVQSHAAIALAKIKTPEAVSELVDLARRNADRDPFIRHAAIAGLSGCATAEELTALKADSGSVRLAAVVALRRQQSPAITEYLSLSSSPSEEEVRVLREAVRAIHDDFSINEALPLVAAMLEAESLTGDEAILRRVISANFRLGTTEAAERLVRFIQAPTAGMDSLLAEKMQVEALQCLVRWNQSPLVDRVEGRIRDGAGRDLAAGKSVLAAKLPSILESVHGNITAEVLRVAEELSLPVDTDLMSNWVSDEAKPANARVAALRLLANAKSSQLPAAMDLAVQSEEWSLQQAGLDLMSGSDPQKAWRHINWSTADDIATQYYISLLPKLRLPKSKEKLSALILEQRQQKPDGVSLDVFNAAKAAGEDMQAWQGELTDASPLGEFQLALHGGDVMRGRAIYKNHVSAQCVRCHEAGGMGKQAGPVLDGLASRVDRQYLLESLVKPSAKIAKGFGGVTLVLTDGRVFTGTVMNETESEIVLGLPNGKRMEFSPDEIDERVEAAISAMPEMTKVLSMTEIRDVVAYLATKK